VLAATLVPIDEGRSPSRFVPSGATRPTAAVGVMTTEALGSALPCCSRAHSGAVEASSRHNLLAAARYWTVGCNSHSNGRKRSGRENNP
jgi:hypothetical protein